MSQSSLESALNILKSGSSNNNYAIAMGQVNGEARYYIISLNSTTQMLHVCNSSGQLLYYLKDTGTTPDTPPTFDATEVITAINSVYSAVNASTAKLTTLIDKVSTLGDYFAIHINNFLSGVGALQDSISSLQSSMEYIFAELTNLYPSDAAMTISSGDTLEWDSAYKRDPVSSFANPVSSSPPIYMVGVNGFSGNAGWSDGVFTLTPSSGSYFSNTMDVGNGSITMPSRVISTAIPNPAHVVPDGYTQYDYIAGTGTQWIDTGYIGALGDTHNLRIGQFSGLAANQAVWGRYYGSGSGYNFDLVSTSASQLGYKYPDKTIPVSAGTDYDISITQSASSCTLVVNGTSSTISNSAVLYNQPIHLLHVKGRTYNSVSARVYGYTVTNSAGNVTLNLVPCSDSSGAVGMYDTVSGIFKANAGTGTFIHGAEIPAQIGTDVVEYYNIVSIRRGAMVSGVHQWSGVDDQGIAHSMSADDCQTLDSSFSASSFNSVDVFAPQNGSYVVTWDDSQTGDIVINYQAMSRFFGWLYKYLNAQQRWYQNTLLPAIGAESCQHTYTTEITQAAACTLPGIVTYTCTQCGTSYSELTDALGHDWICTDHVDTVYASGTDTVEQAGYDVYTCSTCQRVYYDYDGTGAPEDLTGSSISDLVIKLFTKMGSFAGNLVNIIINLLDKLLTGFDDLVISFTEKADQVLSFGGEYPAWLAGVWDILPADLQLALGFAVLVVAFAIIGKKLLFS